MTEETDKTGDAVGNPKITASHNSQDCAKHIQEDGIRSARAGSAAVAEAAGTAGSEHKAGMDRRSSRDAAREARKPRLRQASQAAEATSPDSRALRSRRHDTKVRMPGKLMMQIKAAADRQKLSIQAFVEGAVQAQLDRLTLLDRCLQAASACQANAMAAERAMSQLVSRFDLLESAITGVDGVLDRMERLETASETAWTRVCTRLAAVEATIEKTLIDGILDSLDVIEADVSDAAARNDAIDIQLRGVRENLQRVEWLARGFDPDNHEEVP